MATILPQRSDDGIGGIDRGSTSYKLGALEASVAAAEREIRSIGLSLFDARSERYRIFGARLIERADALRSAIADSPNV